MRACLPSSAVRVCAAPPPDRRAFAPSVAHKRHFVDDRGQRIHRHHLAIESIAVLPMRRMVLLGCEDGHVRVAA